MLLEVSELTKAFKKLEAVSRVSFALNEGEILGLMGPNGAGKTTLIDLISGFLMPSSGTIHFDGSRVSELRPHLRVRRRIARTFQIPRVFYKLSVWDNISVACFDTRRFGEELLPIEPDKRCSEILHRLDLWPRREEKAGRLTHFDLRKLEIGRALATRPKLLLLDEPFAGLSLEEIQGLMETIRGIHRLEITIVLVEHVMRVLMDLSTRVVVLVNGKKIAEGSPGQISKDENVIRAYLGKEARLFAESA